MPGATRPPQTYDEITARTVPDPDSSYRPTREQEREAFSRVEPPPDDALAARIREALIVLGDDLLSRLSVEIDSARVIVRGPVPDIETWRRLDDHLRAVEGVQSLDNRTHVG